MAYARPAQGWQLQLVGLKHGSCAQLWSEDRGTGLWELRPMQSGGHGVPGWESRPRSLHALLRFPAINAVSDWWYGRPSIL